MLSAVACYPFRDFLHLIQLMGAFTPITSRSDGAVLGGLLTHGQRDAELLDLVGSAIHAVGHLLGDPWHFLVVLGLNDRPFRRVHQGLAHVGRTHDDVRLQVHDELITCWNQVDGNRRHRGAC